MKNTISNIIVKNFFKSENEALKKILNDPEITEMISSCSNQVNLDDLIANEEEESK